MTDTRARAAAEELAKRLAVAWWSADGITKGHPEANQALWFATENVEMWWTKATEQQPFFLAMATVLLPVMAARVANAVEQAVKDKDLTIQASENLRGEANRREVRTATALALAQKVIQERAEEIALLKQQKAESEESMVIVGRTVASMAEEIARLRAALALYEASDHLVIKPGESVEAVAAERERLTKVNAALVKAIGPHTRSCEVCKKALRQNADELRAPGRPVATMLNTPITEAERQRISKDGP